MPRYLYLQDRPTPAQIPQRECDVGHAPAQADRRESIAPLLTPFALADDVAVAVRIANAIQAAVYGPSGKR